MALPNAVLIWQSPSYSCSRTTINDPPAPLLILEITGVKSKILQEKKHKSFGFVGYVTDLGCVCNHPSVNVCAREWAGRSWRVVMASAGPRDPDNWPEGLVLGEFIALLVYLVHLTFVSTCCV